MEPYSEIVSLYDMFYMNVSGNRDFLFKPTERQKASIKNFIALLEKDYSGSIGKSFLFYYFAFQFYRWKDKQTRFGKGVVQLTWVIGKKALLEYKKTNVEPFQVELFLKEYGISQKAEISTYTASNDDIYRRKFYNKPGALAYCNIYTSLFDENSKYCAKCTQQKECIKLLACDL